MNTISPQYDKIDDLLNGFSAEDPKEIEAAIQALQSITDSNHPHVIHPSLKDRVSLLHKLIVHSPNGEQRDTIFTKVLSKIREFSMKILNLQLTRLLSNFPFGYSLNDQLIINKAEINSLVEKVKKDPTLEELLFELIQASKHTPGASIAAANAITILSYAGVSLCGRDFRGIRIPDADISHAFLDEVNFTKANLQGVNFS